MGAATHEEKAPPQAQTPAPQETPKPNGYCANCAIRVDDGVVFCDDFCAREWRTQHQR